MSAQKRLLNEFKELQDEKWVNIELKDNSVFRWNIGLMVINSDSAFDGGYFKAEMTFTDTYPYSPPTFRFLKAIWHPNIYPDGKLCISILHPPGDDVQSGESARERWSPLQGVESVLRSVLLLLDSPEISSPANVDAGVMYRDDRISYNVKARVAVDTSKLDIPMGFVVPRTLEPEPPVKSKMGDEDDFMAESDDENDFGASDSSDQEFEMDDDDDNDMEEESDQE